MKYKILIGLTILLCLLLTSCGNSYENNDAVVLGYTGEINELPLFIAYEKGYFKHEGINVKLVKIKYDDIKNSINNGRVDGITCDYRIFKLMDDETKIKLGAGLCSAAIQILVKDDSKISNISELKGKKIGVINDGDYTMVAANTQFLKNDFSIRDVNWVYGSSDVIANKLNNREVDAIITLENDNNSSKDLHVLYKATPASSSMSGNCTHQNTYYFTNFAGLSETVFEKCPHKSAGILRAWIEGTNYVSKHKKISYSLAIKKGYIDNDNEYNLVKNLMWMPGVQQAKKTIVGYIEVQKFTGVLNNKTNTNKFYKKHFASVLPFWD